MRLLYVVGRYPSPSETFIAREIDGLKALGATVRVCAVEGIARRTLLAAIASHPPKAVALGSAMGATTSLKRRLSAAARALVLSPQVKSIDRIHAHFLGLPSMTAWCLSRLTGVPYSLTAHARDIYVEQTPEVVLRDARFRTTCTEAAAAFLAKRLPDYPFHVVRHGIEAQVCRAPHDSPPSEPLRLLAVGRMVEKKGFIHLVRACGILAQRGVPFECTFAGDGPERPGLKSESKRSGLESRIRFAGFVDSAEVARLLAEADVLVAPSVIARDGDRDGVPNVILEAMAAGVAVVACDAGALQEAVTHEETGLLVPPGDPDVLAQAIARLHGNPALRRALSQAAWRRIKGEFDAARWFERLAELFRD